YYALLSIPKNATQSQIKSAYHRALLTSHPDKRKPSTDITDHVDINLLKRAYEILSDPELRASYDTNSRSKNQAHSVVSGPRPAQVVSLEEFEESDDQESWSYPCRCSGSYRITTSLMEQGVHLIGCNSCSEAVWVGYELLDEE
ncbi:DnaJ domain-containing protein, partial [Panaeolus papilionaceus]